MVGATAVWINDDTHKHKEVKVKAESFYEEVGTTGENTTSKRKVA